MSARPLRVWLVDDDASIRWVLERALKGAGMLPRVFEAAELALDALRGDSPDVLVTDIRMPGLSGLDLVRKIHGARPQLPVIVMTAHADLDNAVSAYESGAFEYLPKPFDIDQVVELVKRAAQSVQRASPDNTADGRMSGLLGQAPAMQQVFRAIGRLSRSAVTVLITGESGTGKELVARALHGHSPRANKPFIALNTSAIPSELLESELFGHEKGAFTGADALRRGRFEQADGGTLFLDEIGDMSLSAQAKVLRVLQDGVVTRIGGSKPIQVDVRVLAATNKHLEDEIANGRFREDLFYRLNVVPITVPPLRERREDIEQLVVYFLQQFAARDGLPARGITDEALVRLSELDWPGNVRELRNTVERLVILASASLITATDVERLVGKRSAEPAGLGNLVDCSTFEEFKVAAERAFLLAKLRAFDWNVSETARALDMPRSNLYKKIERYALTRESTPA